MAFTHGRLTKCYVNGYDLTAYLNSITLSDKADVAETSVFGLSSKTYISGLEDCTLQMGGLYDSATNADVDVLNNALAAAANQIWLVFPQGDTLGLDGWGFSGVATDISITAPLTGAVMVSGTVQSSVGSELGVSLHALGIESATINSTGVDSGVTSTLNGGAAYLLVTAAVALTTATIKVQDSANNSTFADIGTFTAVTAAPATQRLVIAGTIRQYTRSALTTLTGTSITYAVLLARF